eukprot:TRINITY_DN8654_c0_g1_i4.p1 TRINITY_DN8654_c0_g1~~TRINITY_DN8654_c0_g1_i4.p1  ORF type:complete len:483 (+),score=66.72 TRINITY_DN8654_c0_g1_i4:127-1575(+)
MGAAASGASCSDIYRGNTDQNATHNRPLNAHDDDSSGDEGEKSKVRVVLAREKATEEKRAAILEKAKTAAAAKVAKAQGDSLELCREGGNFAHRTQVAICTSPGEEGDPFFLPQRLHVVGTSSTEALADNARVGLRSVKGFLPVWDRPCQDEAFFVQTKDQYRFCVMIDGHGPDGHHLAATARDILLRRLLAQIPSARPADFQKHRAQMKVLLLTALRDVHSALIKGDEVGDARASGLSAIILVHDQKSKYLFCSWIGNCRCVLGELQDWGEGKNKPKEIWSDSASQTSKARSQGSHGQGSGGGKSSHSGGKSSKSSRRKRRAALRKIVAMRFTEDHTLIQAEERVRIAMTGAHIIPGTTGLDEVYMMGRNVPGLPISRCCGNLIAQQLGIIADPEFVERPCEEYLNDYSSKIQFVILATDGIWTVLRDQTAVNIVYASDQNNVQYAVSCLIGTSKDLWHMCTTYCPLLLVNYTAETSKSHG